jgi:hypothetical protein
VKCAYLYYRIDPARKATAAKRIDALLEAMAEHCARTPRRVVRCDDATTWMEIYEGIADYAAFATALDAAALDFGCATFTRGGRHVECFSMPDPAPS